MRYRIPPKPTTYCDVRFRSQLEASWVVVFETLGLNWLYEPETYRLSDGRLYVPDFVVELLISP